MTNIETLNWVISSAVSRELRDDHLNTDERLTLVHAFKKLNPNIELPDDVDDAFVAIIF
jgi:hypothetical protein